MSKERVSVALTLSLTKARKYAVTMTSFVLIGGHTEAIFELFTFPEETTKKKAVH